MLTLHVYLLAVARSLSFINQNPIIGNILALLIYLSFRTSIIFSGQSQAVYDIDNCLKSILTSEESLG